MSLFNFLPIIPKCCYCLSLRLGCLLIGFYQLVMGTLTLTTECLAVRKEVGQSVDVYLGIVFSVIFVISALVLLVGIYTRNPVLLDIFLYVMAVRILVGVLYGIFIIAASLSGYDYSLYLGILCLIIVVVEVYFMIVIRSYLAELE